MSRFALDIPGYEEQSIWGHEEGLPDAFAQLWRNGSRSDPPEVWIIEGSLEGLVQQIADSVEPPRTFDEVFFLLAERDPLPHDLRDVFAAYVAQSTDLEFLRRAARSSEKWVAYEAERNPYHAPGSGAQRSALIRWLRALFRRGWPV